MPEPAALSNSNSEPPPPGWISLPPAHLPHATYFPSGLAMGVTFLFWGFITSWVVCAVGLVLFAAALAGWISDLRYERKHTH